MAVGRRIAGWIREETNLNQIHLTTLASGAGKTPLVEVNTLGALHSAASWTDSTGDLWLFGGYGYAKTDNLQLLVFNPGSSQNAEVKITFLDQYGSIAYSLRRLSGAPTNSR